VLFLGMKFTEIINTLESFAPNSLQEEYDNSGLIIGNKNDDCTGVLLSLDVTESIVLEAKQRNCNLIVAHHPIVFKGVKRLNGRNYVEKTIQVAIKTGIAIYACHTNIDNVLKGVNGKIANKIGLISQSVLLPKENSLVKISIYAPPVNVKQIEKVVFEIGGGSLGNYSECSFISEGIGGFKPGDHSDPFVGDIGVRHETTESKLEIISPFWLQNQIISAVKTVHPYEEVAYEINALKNEYNEIGAGLIGELPESMSEIEFLNHLKSKFHLKAIKHTRLLNKKIKKVAVCGGSGSFLINQAKSLGADIFVTSDVKYHEFFDADDQLILADIGHYESEQFTIDLFDDILKEKFPNFAILKTNINTNPVEFYL